MLRRTCDLLDLEYLMREMSPVVSILLLLLTPDAGSDEVRTKDELGIASEQYPNVLVVNLHCLAHQLGLGSKCTSEIDGTLFKIFQIVGCVREQDHEAAWFASSAGVLSARISVDTVSKARIRLQF